MFTGITSHVAALVTAVVALTGAPILRSGAAAADPNQDDQFLAILDQEGIPAVKNVPSLVVTAHKICGKIDGGMPVGDVVDMLINDAYAVDPPERLYPRGRLARTETRFVIASVEAYCPGEEGKIASVLPRPVPGSNRPTHRTGTYARSAVNQEGDSAELVGAVFPVGITAPDPPQIPAPPPAAKNLTPPRPVVAPPPPKRPPPPPPQQPPPPALAPQPGSGAGSGGDGTAGGGNGGGGGAGPAQPAPPMPPGFVRLAP
jgi:hypothetical protein